MEYLKYINFREVSKHLGGTGTGIRKNNIPKKHERAIQELNDLLKHWQSRY